MTNNVCIITTVPKKNIEINDDLMYNFNNDINAVYNKLKQIPDFIYQTFTFTIFTDNYNVEKPDTMSIGLC